MKKAHIKVQIRQALAQRPDMAVALTRTSPTTFTLDYENFGSQHVISEFDDEGDPSTEAEYDDIYMAVEAIVSEHNAAL
tara:strand:+ start:916 stop:1152 length:237 start_codon:yes stop_codon:yes gene_type:complete